MIQLLNHCHRCIVLKKRMYWKEKKRVIDLFRAYSSCRRETRRVCGQICSWRIVREREFGFRGAYHSKMNRQSLCRLEDHRSEWKFSAQILKIKGSQDEKIPDQCPSPATEQWA